jgi:hypothetical protein
MVVHYIADGLFYIVVFVTLTLMALKINGLRLEVSHLRKKVRVMNGEEPILVEENLPEEETRPGQVIESMLAEAKTDLPLG